MIRIKRLILQIIFSLPGGELRRGLYLLSKHHLLDTGWIASFINRMPIDNDKNPLPWFTYGSIYFLQDRLKSTHNVFEYGSGNSTLWLSRKVNSVVSIEHDKEWYHKIKEELAGLSSVTYYMKDLDSGDYEKEILNYKKQFDIIIIDGRQRVQCAKNSLSALKDGGVVVWDNSDRARYEEGYHFLLENGFKRVDFWGVGPCSAKLGCTSVFYPENNCLGL